MILLEGGNIWPDVETNFDPVSVGKKLAAATQKFLNPLKAKLNIIGSCYKPRFTKDGKVVPSNDLDSMVDVQDLMATFGTVDAKSTRKALNDYFQKQGIQTKQAGVTVHTRIPMDGKYYQADIKVIPNAAKVAEFHRHDIPQGSPFKGVNKQLVMNALATSQGMLWSPDEGLYRRDAAGKKAELISDDLNQIAQALLGPTAKAKDLGSVESIMAQIPSEKRRNEIMDMARSGHSWIEPTTTTEQRKLELQPGDISARADRFISRANLPKKTLPPYKFDYYALDGYTKRMLDRYMYFGQEPPKEIRNKIYGYADLAKKQFDASDAIEKQQWAEYEKSRLGRAGAAAAKAAQVSKPLTAIDKLSKAGKWGAALGAGALLAKSAYDKFVDKEEPEQTKVEPVKEEEKNVGRKYQHIEDLILSHGSHGGLHAVERLRDMATTGGTIELKWDGMPVVYWGRDESGNFMMIPKNAWAYLKRGQTQTKSGAPTLTKSPQDVAKFIMGTGSGDPKERAKFAKQFAVLWPYFEKISPKQGFIEGGLLFYPGTKPDGQSAMPVLNKETNTYDFQPNITEFHIPADSDLGKKIAKAKVGVAATGYYSTIGSSDEQRYPDAQNLSTNDVLVQGTTLVQEPVKINTKMLDNVEKFIQSHASKIDKYLAPKPGLSKPAGELYTYLNQHLRTTGLANDFPAWAQANLSPKKAETMLSDKDGMIATLGAIEAITKQKTELIKKLSQQSHGGIRQTKPEGYAQAHPGRKFKYDIPGQFVKAIDQPTWKPRDSDVRESKEGTKKAVLGWGRGMGHTGHDALASAVIHQAENTGGQPFFVVSRSFGKDDPIPPEMKLQMYQKKFPKYKNIFSLPTIDKPTLNDVLTDLASKGYKNVDLVVGADQKEAFGYLLKPAKSTGVEPYKSFGLDNLTVMSRQDTKAPGSNPESPDYHEGPRATPMRQVLMDPSKSEEEQFKVWRDAMSSSLSDEEVLDMMRLAKDNLAKFNTPKSNVGRKMPTTTKGRKLKEAISKMKDLIPKASIEEQKVILDKLVEVKKQLEIEEASSPAQQAAIAISMKKAGKKPKGKVSENTDYLPEK